MGVGYWNQILHALGVLLLFADLRSELFQFEIATEILVKIISKISTLIVVSKIVTISPSIVRLLYIILILFDLILTPALLYLRCA